MKVIFLENKSVVYIDYLNSYLDLLNDSFPKWIRRLVYEFLHFCGYMRCKENRIKLYCIEKDEINQRMIKNLKEKLFIVDCRDVVLSDLLLENSCFVSLLVGWGYNVLNGKWLYKFLCYDIVEKIAYVKNADLSEIEVTVLSNEDSEINIDNIKLLAEKCKVLNVVTDNPSAFRVIEKFLYDEYGSIINVSTNKEKTCRYSDIILNFDFTNDELKKCRVKSGVVIVQFTKEKFENKNGATIIFYRISLPKKYLNIFEKYVGFCEEIFYESLLYHKISFENARRILKRDNVFIKYFEGCNGKLPFQEIKV